MALAVPACGGPHDTRSPPRGRPGNEFGDRTMRHDHTHLIDIVAGVFAVLVLLIVVAVLGTMTVAR